MKPITGVICERDGKFLGVFQSIHSTQQSKTICADATGVCYGTECQETTWGWTLKTRLGLVICRPYVIE